MRQSIVFPQMLQLTLLGTLIFSPSVVASRPGCDWLIAPHEITDKAIRFVIYKPIEINQETVFAFATNSKSIEWPNIPDDSKTLTPVFPAAKGNSAPQYEYPRAYVYLHIIYTPTKVQSLGNYEVKTEPKPGTRGGTKHTWILEKPNFNACSYDTRKIFMLDK